MEGFGGNIDDFFEDDGEDGGGLPDTNFPVGSSSD